MTEDQRISILNFVESIFDEDGVMKDIDEREFESLLNSLSLKFNLAVIKKDVRRLSEEEKVLSIINAIDFLNRIGKQPNIKDISKIVKRKEEHVRILMIKYNLYDPFEKKVKNKLKFWET